MKKALHRWLLAPVLAVMTAALLAGCGGGGGSSSSGTGGTGGTGGNPPSPTASIANITGVLQDKGTGILLAGRTVTVQGTSLSTVTDSNGAFSIANVPTTSVTLVIVDASGTSNGTYSVDISTLNGNPRSLGTIQLNVSSNAPPGAPIIGG